MQASLRPIMIVALCSILLSACVSTPNKIQGGTADTTSPVVIPVTNPTIATDLQSASYNLDQAVTVGALSKDDPAPKCLHGVLQQAGLESTPGAAQAQSFVPKNDGVASLGSIAYIQVQQAKQLTGRGVTVPVDCKALLGQFVIDGLTTASKVVPVLRPLSVLR